VLRGRLLFFTFHANGTLLSCTPLGPAADAAAAGDAPPAAAHGVDIAAGTYHAATAAAGAPAVVWEANAAQGGFKGPGLSKQAAAWAPAEGRPEAAAYLRGLVQACPGAQPLVESAA
jgi:hypothetical protein